MDTHIRFPLPHVLNPGPMNTLQKIILMTLQLLYDYYIQLSTIELPLDNTLHIICTCTHVRKNGLSKPWKTSLTLRPLWWDQLFDILMMVDGGELMPSLVVHDGVRPLNGDILLKENSYLCCIHVH